MNFTDALIRQKAAGRIPLIPDIKCFSPKDGDLMGGRNPVELAQRLQRAGACAISVVTEETEFHGSMELLRKVCAAVSVPVLRKDFVTEEKDLDETKAAGAQAILLMVSCLGEEKLIRLYHAAIAKGLTPFVETHTPGEYAFALSLGAELVGINNRDITVLEKDDGTVAHAESILKEAAGQQGKKRPFLVVESALRNGTDVRKALQSGADGVLVGTAILKVADPIRRYESMTRWCGMKICGLMSREDVEICLKQDADILGFVVQYPVDVRWNLQAAAAKELICQVKAASPETETCVVTGGTPEAVIRLIRQLQPDLVQLHYRETMEETAEIAGALEKDGIGVIRSIPAEPAIRREMFGSDELQEICRVLAFSNVSGVLLDSRDAGNAASGGGEILQLIDETAAEEFAMLKDAGKMVLIGGGIRPGNAAQVYRALQPDCLDVMTGAEGPDGRKSADRIRELMLSVH